MGWIKRALGIERRAAEVEIESTLLQSLLDDSDVTRETALQVPTISGGIDLLGALVASTPIKLYHEHDGKAHEIVGDPRIRLLNDETGDTLNANEFWRAMVRDYYLGKGGYAYIQRSGLSIIGLYYVDERNISVARGADAIFKEYDILVQGKRYLPHDFLRVLRNTRDGAEGIPITRESKTLISTAYQTLLLERKLALMGGNKKGFIQSAKKLTQEAIEQIRKSWNEIHSNNARADNIVVLNDGVTFKESSATSVELQLNENKRTNADEFAKIFHVPSGMIGGTATQSDIASLARLAAIPLMEAIECALNRDLLLESEKGSLYFAFDTKELLKADMQTRFNAYKTALDANFMQIDEVRFAEDLDPLGLTWIKLGLQDVLYDPRTKQIYTPNTNQTTQMDEQPLPTESDHGILDERAQKRRTNGQFGESDGMGGKDSGGTGGQGSAAEAEAPPKTRKQPNGSIVLVAGEKERYRKNIIGTKCGDGVKITRFGKSHVLGRIAKRGISPKQITDALKDKHPDASKTIEGRFAYKDPKTGVRVIVDHKDGAIVTVTNE